MTLRTLFKPVDHTIRDWTHIMVGDGVGNSVLGYALQALKKFNYPMQSVRDFLAECRMPSKYGKARPEWLKDSRLKLTTLTSFSGIILSIVPILYLYMLSFCQDDPRLEKVFESVRLLHYICGILATGTDKPMNHIDTLKQMMIKLHALFAQLDWHYKPKIHHMHHIIDSMLWLGKCLSCFVTERKHRQVKDAALHVFRYIEHAVIVDVVNQRCEQILSGHDLFSQMILVEPRECALQPELLTSSRAVLECGMVAKGDVVVFADMICGVVLAFFDINDVMFVEVRLMPAVSDDGSLRDDAQTATVFKECRLIVDSCIWHNTEQAGIVRVCLPPILFFEKTCTRSRVRRNTHPNLAGVSSHVLCRMYSNVQMCIEVR
jgi:hypothetical protein